MTNVRPKNISFILDESDSMEVAKVQTISGFNEYIATLRNDPDSKDAKFSLTHFNSEKVDISLNSVGLDQIPELTDQTYRPAALTPLYDAIGRTIAELKGSAGDSDVLVVIMTDGEENASREYNRSTIFTMIEERKKSGWNFIFLGANQDAYAAGMALGISVGNTANYNQAKTSETMRAAARATMSYTHGNTASQSIISDDEDKSWQTNNSNL